MLNNSVKTSTPMPRYVQVLCLTFFWHLCCGSAWALEPDLPKRLLAGEAPRHPVRPIRTGIGPVDRMGLLEVTWYTKQLKRIGSGLSTRPKTPALWVFFQFLWAQMRAGKRRKPTRLRAS
mgnify:CR=1 FL=1